MLKNNESVLKTQGSRSRVKKQNTEKNYTTPLKAFPSVNKTDKKHNLSLRASNKSVKIIKNVKHIAAMHAYHPQLLKECLVSDYKSYNKLFGQTENCQLNSIFLKGLIVHFRKWRVEIEEKINHILEIALNDQKMIQKTSEQTIMTALNEIEKITHKLKVGLEEVHETHVQDMQINKLMAKFTSLQSYLQGIIKLIGNLCEFSSEIAILFTNNNQDSNQLILKRAEEIISKYQKIALQPLNYCLEHTESKIFLKMEFKIKEKFQTVRHSILFTFHLIQQLQLKYQTYQHQILLFQNQSQLNITYLQHLIQFLYSKNQEIKEMMNKTQNFSSSFEKVIRWQKQFNERENRFIENFLSKVCNFIKIQFHQISSFTVLHLIKNKGKQLMDWKKKALLIIKILQENREREMTSKMSSDINKMIQHLSSAVKATSARTQSITEKVESLIEEVDGNKKRNESNVNISFIQKCFEKVQVLELNLRDLVLSHRSLHIQICNILLLNSELISPILPSNSSTLNKLIHLLSSSRNQIINNPVFQQLLRFSSEGKVDSKDNKKLENVQVLLKQFQQVNKVVQVFIENSLQRGYSECLELKRINQEEIVHYILDQNASLINQEFIIAYDSLISTIKKCQIFKQKCYQIETTDSIDSERISLAHQFKNTINQSLKNIKGIYKKQYINSFIIFIYQHSIIQILHGYQVFQILNKANQIDFKDLNQNQNLKKVLHFRKIYKKVIEQTENKSKNVSRLQEITRKLYIESEQYCQKGRLAFQFNKSRQNCTYFPTMNSFQNWLSLEYQFFVDQSITIDQVQAERSTINQLITLYLSKLDGLKNKLKLNYCKVNERLFEQVCLAIDSLQQINIFGSYSQIVNSICTYLRAMKIKHLAIFTRNNEPIFILPFKNQQIEQYFEIKLYLPPGTIASKKHLNIMQKISLEELGFFKVPTTKAQQLIYQDFQEKIKLHHENIPPQQKDNVKEQIGGQGFGEFILDEDIKDGQKPIINKPVIKQQSLLESDFEYYKLNRIESIETIRKCMKFYLTKFQRLNHLLNLEILAQVYSLPKEGIRQSITHHLSCITQETASNDLANLLDLDLPKTQSQQLIFHFQTTIQSNNREASIQHFEKLCDHFEISCIKIYRNDGDFVMLLHKLNEQSTIGYASLNKPFPKMSFQSLGLNEVVENILEEHMKSSKNEHFIDETNELIEQINVRMAKSCDSFKASIKCYDHIKLTNLQTVESQVNLYLSHQVPSQQTIAQFQHKILSSINPTFMNHYLYLQIQSNSLIAVDNMFTIKFDETVLYFSNKKEQITIDLLCKCLLLHRNQFNKLEKSNKFFVQTHGSIQILTKQLADNIFFKQKILPLMSFSEIQKLLISNECVDRLKTLIVQFESTIQQTKNFLPFFEPIRYQLLPVMIEAHHRIDASKCLLQFIMNNSKENLITHKLEEFSNKLDQNEISHWKLEDRTGIILALMENENIEHVMRFLNIPSTTLPELQDQIEISISKKVISIKKLYLVLQNIVPPFKNESVELMTQFEGKMNEFLQQSYLSIRSSHHHLQKNSLFQIIHSLHNQIQIQIHYPSTQIQINLEFLSQEQKFTLPVQQYHFFIHLQHPKLYAFLAHKITCLWEEVHLEHQKRLSQEFQRKKKIEEQRRAEEIIRQQQLQEIKRIQQEKLKKAKEEIQKQTKIEKERNQNALKQIKLKKQIESQQQKIIKHEKEQRPPIMQEQFEEKQESQNLSISYVFSEGWERKVEAKISGNIAKSGIKHKKEEDSEIQYDLVLSECCPKQRRQYVDDKLKMQTLEDILAKRKEGTLAKQKQSKQ